ncbi:MAG TPA: T9SS type A sorting domain-containing protein, partial [Ignavibacteriaceae bacterium]
MNTTIFKMSFLISFFLIFLISYSGTFSQNVGAAAYIEVNDIYLPFNNSGVIADVNVPPNGSLGQFAGGGFLFSSGFWLSGYTGNTLWANGVASASLVEDYLAGTVGMDPNDPKASIYKLSENDIPFGQSWQDWIDAVDLGADFYDGNDDGIYNPVDLNGNNLWDPDEDKPDLILDETYWCVFNDGVPSGQRRWQSEPQGIEIRQTIFATSSAGAPGNVVFVRYRIKNTGTVADTLKDVYLSMWADADVGDASDDVYGSDTVRQGTYFYNNNPDQVYGNQVPSFMMDLLTGPLSYIPGETFIDVNGNNIYENGIDTPLDTAVNYLGPIGITIFPGAKNLELTSSVFYIGGDPNLRDPNNLTEARNYILGKDRIGNIVDPCTFAYGEVRGGVDCNFVNPFFWFSGDPVTDVGWICTQNRDVRGIGSIGQFTLIKNQEIEVLIGYEIDRSTTPLGGIIAVRSVSDAVQTFYENNFGYPIVSVGDEQPVVSTFKLEQNYPNPFNPSTKIKFTIPQSPLLGGDGRGGLVTLKVYDVLGNEITTLVNEELSPGEYEVTFNVRTSRDLSLSSGIYFYTLRSGSFVQTRKMV